MNGKILIEDYKIHCIVGINPQERVIEQEIAVDLEVKVDFTQAVLKDSIESTVNYETLVDVCKKLALSKKYYLIETFAYEALHEIFSAFPSVSGVKIRVKKKSALPLATHAAIEFERERF